MYVYIHVHVHVCCIFMCRTVCFSSDDSYIATGSAKMVKVWNRYVHVHVGVLCCFALFVCLTLLASFFLPSHLSFKNMYIYINVHVHVHEWMPWVCCVALLCCSTLLASSFLPSHLSLKCMKKSMNSKQALMYDILYNYKYMHLPGPPSTVFTQCHLATPSARPLYPGTGTY